MEQQAENLSTALMLLRTISTARDLWGDFILGEFNDNAQEYANDLFSTLGDAFVTTANLIVELTPKTEETTTNTASL